MLLHNLECCATNDAGREQRRGRDAGPKRARREGGLGTGDGCFKESKVVYTTALVAHDVLTSSSSYFIYEFCTVFMEL